MIKSIFHYVRYKARKHVFDCAGIDNTVFLAGSGRSGTTWLSNAINHDNSYRYMFEPFHPECVAEVRHFDDRQYIRPTDKSSAFLSPARRILAGQINNRWINKYNNRIVINRRLIKDIRANLFLGWLTRHFRGIPLVLLLRHPCAVAHSQLNCGWSADLDGLLSQSELVEDFLKPHVKAIRGVRDPFERLVVQWCVETAVPLQQLERGAAFALFYENVCEEPELEMRALFDYLKQPFDIAVVKTMKLPSLTTRVGSAVRSGGDASATWEHNVSTEHRVRSAAWLERFGISHLYGTSARPKCTGRETITSACVPAACTVGK